MGNYTIFRCSKILGEEGKQEILQQMFRMRKMLISAKLLTKYVIIIYAFGSVHEKFGF